MGTNNNAGSAGVQERERLRRLVRSGKASKFNPMYSIDKAIEKTFKGFD